MDKGSKKSGLSGEYDIQGIAGGPSNMQHVAEAFRLPHGGVGFGLALQNGNLKVSATGAVINYQSWIINRELPVKRISGRVPGRPFNMQHVAEAFRLPRGGVGFGLALQNGNLKVSATGSIINYQL